MLGGERSDSLATGMGAAGHARRFAIPFGSHSSFRSGGACLPFDLALRRMHE
jgi:hypothetical protein